MTAPDVKGDDMRNLSVFAAAVFAVSLMVAPSAAFAGCTYHTAETQSTMTSDSSQSTSTVVVGTDGE